MNINRLLQKLNLYKQNPDIVQPLTPAELADLVIVVLDQVKVIDQAIKEGRLDGYTPEADKDYLSKDTAIKLVTDSVNAAVSDYKKTVTSVQSDLENRVMTAIANLQNGKDGVVTEEEIQRAADTALSLIKLPDFEQMVATAINADGEAVRNALELLSGDERYKVEIPDVVGLQDKLEALAQKAAAGGGTIGKQQVYGFIRSAITEQAIGVWTNGSSSSSKLTVSATQPSNPSTNDLWVDVS